jgi:hypothetical protein
MESRKHTLIFKLWPDLRLPVTFLSKYLFFLTRRPISRSNLHYLEKRVGALRSLRELLQEVEDPLLHQVCEQLKTFTPANFSRLLQSLQQPLTPLVRDATEMPRDIIFSRSSPPKALLTGARKVLLLLGPNIGIGDEIIFFPLPGWFKQANPEAEITVLSAYDGLWDRVENVLEAFYYTDYLTLIKAIRGTGQAGQFDVVMMADFEKPRLYEALCDDPNVGLFIELSLGTHSVSVLDNRRRWLYYNEGAAPYFINYYSALDNLLRWLGLRPQAARRFDTIKRDGNRPPADHLRIFVSPFTSKYDPAQLFWSRLLASLFGNGVVRPVRLVLDPGPNLTTARFAAALVNATKARLPAGVTLEVARGAGGHTLPLDGVFEEMERSHAVICTDSFSAHAAPLFSCTTLVLASADLENWRVPFSSSFYFNSADPPAVIVAGMRQVLKRFQIEAPAGDPPPLALSNGAVQLDTATVRLQELFENDAEDKLSALRPSYEEFVRSYESVARELGRWPGEFLALFHDYKYDQPLRQLRVENLLDNDSAADFLAHLQDQFERWQNTNFCKYLRWLLASARAQS